MAELMGRETGVCQGLGGSMHLVDIEHGFMGATGVVGGNLPLALGSALAQHLRGTDAVTVVFFGDGAVQAGHFNESVNLAALWKLPVIFVCENNGMAEFTSREEHSTIERVSDVVAPYGFDRNTVDGSDVAGGLRRVRRVPAAARAGDGPVPPGMRHATAAAATTRAIPRSTATRSPSRSGPSATRSPASRLRAIDEAGETEAVEREARRSEIEAAVSFARESPFPDPQIAQHPGVRDRMTETTFVEAIKHTLARAMREDARVIVLGEDVAEGGPYLATAGLAEEFGRERVRNTPISEGAVCGVAIGAAQAGLRPVVEIMFIDFITLALDQLVNQAAKAHFMSGGQLSVPLVLRTQGGSGQRNGAQHSQSLEAWLTHVPGLKVVMPSCAADAAGLLESAIADPNPVVFVENKSLYFRRETVPDPPEAVRIGRAQTLRQGKDVTIVALSRLVGDALEAADKLASDGIEAEVIDPRTLVPLDLDTLAQSLRRTGRAVIAHEAVAAGGFGAELARTAAGGRVRLPRGPDPARRRAVHAGAGQPAARGRLSSRGAGDRSGGASRARVGRTRRRALGARRDRRAAKKSDLVGGLAASAPAGGASARPVRARRRARAAMPRHLLEQAAPTEHDLEIRERQAGMLAGDVVGS